MINPRSDIAIPVTLSGTSHQSKTVTKTSRGERPSTLTVVILIRRRSRRLIFPIFGLGPEFDLAGTGESPPITGTVLVVGGGCVAQNVSEWLLLWNFIA